ncbi:MAG: S8 family serine peptidase [Blastocatellia bacterium]
MNLSAQAMRLSVRLLVGLALVLLFLPADWVKGLTWNRVGAVSVPPQIQAKISPVLLEQMVDGGAHPFLVHLRERADLSGADRLVTKEEKGRYVFETLVTHSRRTQAGLLRWLEDRHLDHQPFYLVNAVLVHGDPSAAMELAARPEVARIEANPMVQGRSPILPEGGSDLAQTAPPQGVEPGIVTIRAHEVWAAGSTGRGIVIGGQDTGIQWDHPALRRQYRGWSEQGVTHDYNWHDSIRSGGGVCGPQTRTPCDDDNHGTHTMGTALGWDGQLNRIGVAPDARFIGCRNMDRGNGTPATYLECFQFFLAPYPYGARPDQGDPTKAPHLTINSWSCPPSEGCSALILREAVEAQRAAGIMTITAAGNSGPSCSSLSDPPAIYQANYTIGAIDSNGLVARFSSRGPVTVDGSGRRKPDLMAPGLSVRSAVRGNSYGSLSGTSMATPHVVGAVALLWSAFPQLRGQIEQTENLLNQTAVPTPVEAVCGSTGTPNTVYGAGRLDVKRAYDQMVLRFYALAGQVTNWQAESRQGWVQFSRVSGTGAIPEPVRIDSNGFWGQNGFEVGTIYRATPIQSRTIFSPPYREVGSPQTELNFTRRTRGILIEGPRPTAVRESSPLPEKSP